jgi:hypothetical protein
MSLPASENGPMHCAKTGRSVTRICALRIVSTFSPVRPSPTFGTASASASSSDETSLPMIVGISSALKTVSAPNASASTDKSIC